MSKCFEMFFATFRTPELTHSFQNNLIQKLYLETLRININWFYKKICFRKNRFFMIFFIIFLTHHPSSGAESAISSLVRICFSHLPSIPDSRGDISALRRSWKVFLGSKFAYSSSTFRKTKQLMVLATSEKAIPKCQKNCRMAKIIVIASRISVTELISGTAHLSE